MAKFTCLKIAIFVIAVYSNLLAQNVGVNTPTPHASAALEVQATDKGLLPPRLTTVQRDAIVDPAPGLIIFNVTSNCLNFYNGSRWVSTCVDAPPCVAPPAPAASSNSPVCESSTLTLSASAVSGATYIWTGPNDFYSTAQTPSISDLSLTAAGNYTVRSWVAGCYSSESVASVTVVPQQWSQMADFPGVNRDQAAIFAINDSLYVGTGNVSCPNNCVRDLWRFDVTSNSWLQRADFPAQERYFMVGTTRDGIGYFMGGNNSWL